MISAILSLFALASPVLGSARMDHVDMMGCYGDMGDHDFADVDIMIRAVKGLLIDQDPAAIEKYVADDYIQHNPDAPSGKEGVYGLLELEFEYEVGQVAIMGNTFWMHSRITGVRIGSVIALDIFRFEDGKIAEHWDVIQPEVPANETVSGESMLTISDSPLVKALSK